MQQKEKRLAVAIRMSTKSHDFIKRNPKIANQVGHCLAVIHQLDEEKERLLAKLNLPILFRNDLDNGTDEELEDFLSECNKMVGKLNFTEVTQDQLKDLHETLVDKLGKDHVTITDITTNQQPEM